MLENLPTDSGSLVGLIAIAVLLVVLVGVAIAVFSGPGDFENRYQQINVTDLNVTKYEDRVVTELVVEPYLYCPETESEQFKVIVELYNDSEVLYSSHKRISVSERKTVSLTTEHRNVSIADADRADVWIGNVGISEDPTCPEIANPEKELPRDHFTVNFNG